MFVKEQSRNKRSMTCNYVGKAILREIVGSKNRNNPMIASPKELAPPRLVMLRKNLMMVLLFLLVSTRVVIRGF